MDNEYNLTLLCVKVQLPWDSTSGLANPTAVVILSSSVSTATKHCLNNGSIIPIKESINN